MKNIQNTVGVNFGIAAMVVGAVADGVIGHDVLVNGIESATQLIEGFAGAAAVFVGLVVAVRSELALQKLGNEEPTP